MSIKLHEYLTTIKASAVFYLFHEKSGSSDCHVKRIIIPKRPHARSEANCIELLPVTDIETLRSAEKGLPMVVHPCSLVTRFDVNRHENIGKLLSE